MRPCLKVQIAPVRKWRYSDLMRPAWQRRRSSGLSIQEAVAEHPALREDVVGRTASFGVMRVDRQSRSVMEHTVEHIERFVRRGRDDLDVIGAVLVRNVGVK